MSTKESRRSGHGNATKGPLYRTLNKRGMATRRSVALVARVAVALVVLVLLTLTPSAAAAGWNQVGGNAARTFSIEASGPRLDVLAFEVLLPGHRVPNFPMFIENRAVHTLLYDQSESPEIRTVGVFVTDLDTAQTVRAVSAPPGLDGWAMDEKHYFFATSEGLLALRHNGERAWNWTPPDVFISGNYLEPGPGSEKWCTAPVVADGVLYAACTIDQVRHPVAQVRPGAVVVAIDIASGDEIWVADDENLGPVDSVSMVGDFLMTSEWRQSSDYHAHVMAFHRSDATCWWFIRQHFTYAGVANHNDPMGSQSRASRLATLNVTVIGTEKEVIVDFDTLRGYDVGQPKAPDCRQPNDIQADWTQPSPDAPLGVTQLAYLDSQLFLARGQVLNRVC